MRGRSVVVDQHAAHERLVYEGLKKRALHGKVKRQQLLIPEIFQLPPHKLPLLTPHLEEFATCGLIAEPFGENSLLVREFPALLAQEDIQKLLNHLLEDIEDHGTGFALKERLQEVCATIACHGSVRAGRRLRISEMNHLLREMEKTPHSGQCNHERPTYLKLNLKDIEKLFGRR